MFSWEKTKKPIVALAPMDGYSDSAFRQIIKIIAPDTIVFSEFVSADGLARAPKKTQKLITFQKIEKPIIFQLFGKNPENFAAAAKVLEDYGASGVDLNFGCPAKKVVGSGHGSDLIRNPNLVAEIVAATKKAVKIPVSAKTRLGIKNSEYLISFCEKIFLAGADAIFIHGRTVAQKFSGEADWSEIYKVKENFSQKIVIGNGDIFSAEEAAKKIKNLDGIMIGRGSFGNPFLFRQIFQKFSQQKILFPKISEIIEICQKHAEILEKEKGSHGILEFRKHFLFFVKNFPGAREMRKKITNIKNSEQVKEILKKIKLLKRKNICYKF